MDEHQDWIAQCFLNASSAKTRVCSLTEADPTPPTPVRQPRFYNPMNDDSVRESFERDVRSALRTIPEAYRLTLDDPALRVRVKSASAIGEVRHALRGPLMRGFVMMLRGPSGVGKSTLMGAIGDEICAQGRRSEDHEARNRAIGVRFVPARMMSGGARDEDSAQHARTAEWAPALLLDDLDAVLGGAPPGSALAAVRIELLLSVIASRYDKSRGITIVSTAMDDAELRAAFGDGITRRLLERAVEIQMGGADSHVRTAGDAR